jgi:predicted PolB exonuclease-like 3'-5' exonuclease
MYHLFSPLLLAFLFSLAGSGFFIIISYYCSEAQALNSSILYLRYNKVESQYIEQYNIAFVSYTVNKAEFTSFSIVDIHEF